MTSEQPESLDYILKSNAAVQVFFDKDSMNDYPKLVADIKAYTNRKVIEGKIEAYHHILLSDNGMQELLKSWLKTFVDSLTAELEATLKEG